MPEKGKGEKMKSISINEYKNALIILCEMSRSDIEAISVLFVQIFPTEKALLDFLDTLRQSVSSRHLTSFFRGQLNELYGKKIRRILQDPKYGHIESYEPTLDEISLFLNIRKKPVDEYVFLRVVSYAVFMFCLDTPSKN